MREPEKTLVLVYTCEWSGAFQARRCTLEEYEQVKREGKIVVDPSEDVWRYEPIAFLALAKLIDNHDFILGSSRGTWPRRIVPLIYWQDEEDAYVAYCKRCDKVLDRRDKRSVVVDELPTCDCLEAA